jgi:hypothetical protein
MVAPYLVRYIVKKNILLLNTKIGLKKKFKFDLMVRDDLCNINIDLMNTKKFRTNN